MARIHLVDLDMLLNRRFRVFPNLALMKLSAWHKAQGDEVFLNMLSGGDRTYISSVFTWNVKEARRRGIIPEGRNVKFGGSGFGPDYYGHILPDEIEHIRPDYSIYEADVSIGYCSRGCIRDCLFCIVRSKEGYVKAWAPVAEFYQPGHKLIKLLDNNVLAAPNCYDVLAELADLGVRTDFSQGLDIRVIDEKMVAALLRVNVDRYRFAFDNPEGEAAVRRGIQLFRDAGLPPSRLLFYVLAGHEAKDTSAERLCILHDLGVRVIPMFFRDTEGREITHIETDWKGEVLFHGPRPTIIKYLRMIGRDFPHKKPKGGK